MPVKKPPGISTTVFSIIRDVARKHDLTVPMIMGDSRNKPIVAARQEAIWRIWRERGYAFARIGRVFGKDHTTIMHSIAKHEERLVKAREAEAA
jgi:chromosomal replication initiator protein